MIQLLGVVDNQQYFLVCSNTILLLIFIKDLFNGNLLDFMDDYPEVIGYLVELMGVKSLIRIKRRLFFFGAKQMLDSPFDNLGNRLAGCFTFLIQPFFYFNRQ